MRCDYTWCDWGIWLTATTDASSWRSQWYHVMSRSSTTLTIPTMTYVMTQATGIMIVGAWVRKLRYGGWDHFWMFSCFIACLCFSSLYLGPVPPDNGGRVSLWARSAEQLPLHILISWGTHGFIWVRTRQECILFASLPVPFLLYSLCNPSGLSKWRRIM